MGYPRDYVRTIEGEGMKRVFFALMALCAVALAATAAGATGNLPGGTSIEAAVTAPADHAVLPDAPFTATGTAAVGQGQPVANTTLIYIVDVSGSTANPTGGTSCPRQNVYDLQANTTLDCELLAVRDLNAAAIATGTIAKIGFIGFAGTNTDTVTNITSAAALDLDSTASVATLAAPNLANFTPNAAQASTALFPSGNNLDWVTQSAYYASNPIATPVGWPNRGASDGFTLFSGHDVGTATNYYAALQTLKNLLVNVTTPRTQVVFLSDGIPNETVSGLPLSNVITQVRGTTNTAVTIDTFAVVGAGSTCGSPSPGTFGSLEQIANAFGKHCVGLSNPDSAVTSVPAAIASKLTSAVLKVDGSPIPTTVAPALPQSGPANVALSSSSPLSLAPGDHVICADANGQDGGGAGATPVEDCHTITIKARPTVTLDGGDGPNGTAGSVPEGSPFPIGATVIGASTTSWASSGGTGTCSFGDASSANTTVTCTDDGVYTLTLTVDDGVNPPISVSEHLSVTNVAPTATLTVSAPPHPLAQPVTANVSIADPSADTFVCLFDWADGSTSGGPATGNTCQSSHTYAAGGTYLVGVTVTDDDGGAGSDATTVTVDAPPTIDLGGGGGGVGLSGTEGTPVVLDASVTDATAGLTLHWSATPVSGVDPGATCTFGNDASAPTTVTCTDDGDWQLTLTADDHVNPPVSGTIALHLANANPTLSLASVVSALTATVTGTVGDAGTNDTQTCSFSWGDSSPDTTGVPVAGGTCVASHAYASGTHSSTVTVTATDDDGGSATRSVTITLNRPPSCSAVTPSVADLWPPDHTLRLIVLGGATDPDHDALLYAITSVRQDEPTNGTGDGDTAIDAFNAGPGAVRLRAERSGNGDGRVYTIAFTVSDGKGGTCTGTTQVTVAKSASKPAVLSPGPGYDSYH
jgi:trimeric autotransporter adhesin